MKISIILLSLALASCAEDPQEKTDENRGINDDIGSIRTYDQGEVNMAKKICDEFLSAKVTTISNSKKGEVEDFQYQDEKCDKTISSDTIKLRIQSETEFAIDDIGKYSGKLFLDIPSPLIGDFKRLCENIKNGISENIITEGKVSYKFTFSKNLNSNGQITVLVNEANSDINSGRIHRSEQYLIDGNDGVRKGFLKGRSVSLFCSNQNQRVVKFLNISF